MFNLIFLHVFSGGWHSLPQFSKDPIPSSPWQVDLKSRRELRAVDGLQGALEVVWFDQAVVRAALFGRVLVLEGLEKVGWSFGGGNSAIALGIGGDICEIWGYDQLHNYQKQ